jgi:hypothetical protein
VRTLEVQTPAFGQHIEEMLVREEIAQLWKEKVI